MSVVDGLYRHGRRPARGRPSAAEERPASPLELLFDLTFVAAFGVAAEGLAEGIAAGIAAAAVVGFGLAVCCIVWAWTNFTWFASAFHNDDWVSRLLTAVQMAGVLVLALGLTPLLASVEHGERLDSTTLVAGYVVMRTGLIVQGVRAARADPLHRGTVIRYALVIALAQLGWVALAALPVSTPTALAMATGLLGVEASGPVLAEWGRRARMPWQARHLAERYALLAIIALGETVFGTLAAAGEIASTGGWTGDAVAMLAIGLSASLAMWWCYFLIPHEAVLVVRPGKAFLWGCAHVLVFGAIAATGAGLRTISSQFGTHGHVDRAVVVAAVAIPVLGYLGSLYLTESWLLSRPPRNSFVQLAAAASCGVGIAGSQLGVPLWWCLAAVVAAPALIVVSFELFGWRGRQEDLDAVLRPAAPPDHAPEAKEDPDD